MEKMSTQTAADSYDHAMPRIRHRSPPDSPERRKRHRGAYAASPSSGSSGRVPRVPRPSPGAPASARASAPSTLARPAAAMSRSRRLYVGNIPFHVGLSDVALAQFFSALYVAGFRASAPGEPLPVASVWLHHDGKFGFMELRGEQEAVNMMQMNGVFLHARPLRINRPSDFRPEMHAQAREAERVNAHAVVELCERLGGLAAAPVTLAAAAAATQTPTTPAGAQGAVGGGGVGTTTGGDVLPARNGASPGGMHAKAAVPAAPVPHNGGAPPTAAKVDTPAPRLPSFRSAPSPIDLEKQKRALLKKEEERKNVKPAAPPAETAPISNASPVAAAKKEPGAAAVVGGNGIANANGGRSSADGKVISLVNLVTNEDLEGSDEDYDDLVDDVRGECQQYGKVCAVEIPRAGVWKGTAFIEFSRIEDANAAVKALRTRVFDSRVISSEIVKGCASAAEASRRPAAGGSASAVTK